MNEPVKTEITQELNTMLMEMYDKGIKDYEAAAKKAIDTAILLEREACAKLCEKIHDDFINARDSLYDWPDGHNCADAIRARTT